MSVSASGWIKGITLSIMASIIGGASKLSIRKSWLMEAELEASVSSYADHVEDQPLTNQEQSVQGSDSSRWTKRLALLLRLSGMFGMTFLNPACSVLAMNYASPSILAPFSGLTLVWIVLFSNPLIGEQPSTSQVIAASLIVLGEVVVAVFGDHTNDEGVTLEDLEQSYREPAFIVFFLVMTLWMLLLAYWIRYSTSPFLKRFAWGVSGGSITGLQNFLKDSLTGLKASDAHHFPWYLALWALLAVGTAFGGLLFLTTCMKRYDATYSSAMFVGSFVVWASIMSSVHYKTFQNLDSLWNYVLYPAGLVVLMAGVAMLVLESNESAPATSTDIRDRLIENGDHGVQPSQREEEEEDTRGELT